jgi:hypothetical protein
MQSPTTVRQSGQNKEIAGFGRHQSCLCAHAGTALQDLAHPLLEFQALTKVLLKVEGRGDRLGEA